VGSEHGISGSRDTILRLVHQAEPPALREPHVIGLDDWAWKRRLRYGTLICDLEQGLPIDVLPDRTVETVSAWLKKHPTSDTISRDGSSEYASAIKKGAPQAREVSDRWHLVKNLVGCVSVLLARSVSLSFVVQKLRERPTPLRRSTSRTNPKVIPGREPRNVDNKPVKPSGELVTSKSRLCTTKG
jgi:transposase